MIERNKDYLKQKQERMEKRQREEQEKLKFQPDLEGQKSYKKLNQAQRQQIQHLEEISNNIGVKDNQSYDHPGQGSQFSSYHQQTVYD